jgi:diadenylate cyclase
MGISTKETGTRHKAAERTANQTETIVIAVSERKNKITIYYKNVRYELERSSEVLRRAAETLQILEKQKDILNDILINFNILEINNLVTISDVCEVLQRMEMIKRISNIVKRYLVELGKEGNILSMRLKELTKNLSKKREMVLMDYFQSGYSHPDNLLKNIDFDMLLEVSNLSKILFEEVHDKSISPRGIRILNKTNLSDKEIKSLINNFKNLSQIFNAEVDSLMTVLKNEDVVSSLVQDLEVLKEKILVGKKF